MAFDIRRYFILNVNKISTKVLKIFAVFNGVV